MSFQCKGCGLHKAGSPVEGDEVCNNCRGERAQRATKPYSPPSLTLLQGRTADEVLQASHALLDLMQASQGPPSWRYAVTGYVRVVCAHLESLTRSDTLPSGALPNPPTEPPPPMTATCPTCDGQGTVELPEGRRTCTTCFGQGSVTA